MAVTLPLNSGLSAGAAIAERNATAAARRLAAELDDALAVLAKYDRGPDLVLYYKRPMVLEGHAAYASHLNPSAALADSQRVFLESQWRQFRTWWNGWPGRGG